MTARERAMPAIERAVEDGRDVLLVGRYAPCVAIARQIQGQLGPMTEHERTWLHMEYAVMGLPPRQPAGWLDPNASRPLRAPHHTVSVTGMVGHAPRGRAGEVHLARFGVLLLDALPEFSLAVIDAVARAIRRMGDTAPRIVASAHPCPCGWHGDTSAGRTCSCPPKAMERYHARVASFASTLGLDSVSYREVGL